MNIFEILGNTTTVMCRDVRAEIGISRKEKSLKDAEAFEYLVFSVQHAILTLITVCLQIIRAVGHTHYVQGLHLPISSEQCHALDTSEYASQSAANSSEYPLIF